MNPIEKINNLLHGKHEEDSLKEKEEEKAQENPYSVESDNLAVPEVHTSEHEEKLEKSETEQNQSNKKDDVVFDSLAIPEIHIKK